MKPAKSSEERVLQSLRQSNVITKAKMDECFALLEATQPCDRCGETGIEPGSDTTDPPSPAPCGKCEGTGQMYTIR